MDITQLSMEQPSPIRPAEEASPATNGEACPAVTPTPTPTSTPPPKCEICAEKASRYKCPRCAVRTCSLVCCKLHKQRAECSGIRNPAEFIKISEFTTKNLLSDYRFLESTNRLSTNLERNTTEQMQSDKQRCKIISRKAREKNIALKFLPFTFSRHISNRTIFIVKLKILCWTCEFVFPSLKLSASQRLLGSITVVEAIAKLFSDNLVPYNQQSLYTRDKYHVLLKQHDCPANEPRYYKLDAGKAITESLEFLTIIENPSYLVVPLDELSSYTLIDLPTSITFDIPDQNVKSDNPERTENNRRRRMNKKRKFNQNKEDDKNSSEVVDKKDNKDINTKDEKIDVEQNKDCKDTNMKEAIKV